MPEHDYAELARALVRDGCRHIASEHTANGKRAARLMMEAAITAQGNLVIDPEFALTQQDFKAVTREVERLKEELSPGITREPELKDDSDYHLRKVRNALFKATASAANLCSQDTLPQVIELLRKAWDIIQEAEEDAATLANFRNQRVLAYIAEFKHAVNQKLN